LEVTDLARFGEAFCHVGIEVGIELGIARVMKATAPARPYVHISSVDRYDLVYKRESCKQKTAGLHFATKEKKETPTPEGGLRFN
jgi:hypothetical protein